MLILTADEEVGDAGVGAPFLVEARPDLRPDYVVGEGAGERFDTPRGPIYLLDCGVKSSSSATLTVHGRAADASLPATGSNAAFELARLLSRLERYEPPRRIHPALEELFDFLAPAAVSVEERVEQAEAASPALARIVRALVTNVAPPSVVDVGGPENVVPEEATVTLKVSMLPGSSEEELEEELRAALGDGDYTLEVADAHGGSTSPPRTPLHDAIEAFLRDRDPEARLVPALGYGFSDCHFLREAYGSVAYGFIPFRHADPMTNLTTKHAPDERVLVDDLVFQAEAALAIARAIGALAH
jgi:acetylornithine deacetylase/succinyl-diaminopimelate desuccinylase-like protein